MVNLKEYSAIGPEIEAWKEGIKIARELARPIGMKSAVEAFGGIQVVAFEDFLQLSPIPNAIDDGKYAFESALWNATFPHQIILEESFRAKDDQEIVTLLNEISKGHCSEQSLKLIRSMKRPLNPSDFQLSYVPQVFSLNELE